MKVLFENAYKLHDTIGEAETFSEAFSIINKFLSDHNFKSYYTRTWVTPNNELYIDVGSHNEFFIIPDITEEEYKKWIGQNQ